MKRLTAILLAAAMVLTLGACGSWDWSLNYSKKVEEGGFDIALNPEGKTAFAAACAWDGTDEGRRIVIPDVVEGCTVFKLGGYFGRGLPMPFYVAVPADQTEPAPTNESGEPTGETKAVRTEEILFTLVIGPYLEEIANVRESWDFTVDEEDGTRVTYHPVFAFEVDEKNPTFYAKDGKLYLKRSSALVTDFEYPAEK